MKNDLNINPIDVADKSIKKNLERGISLALKEESETVRLNTQLFNTRRNETVKELEDYEELKSRARQIKEDSISIALYFA